MINYDGETTIDRPASEVFAFATAPENLPKWSDVSEVEMLSDGPMGVGTTLRMTMGRGPMRATTEFETSEWEEDRTWTFRTVPPSWILWNATYLVEPLGPSSSRFSTRAR